MFCFPVSMKFICGAYVNATSVLRVHAAYYSSFFSPELSFIIELPYQPGLHWAIYSNLMFMSALYHLSSAGLDI